MNFYDWKERAALALLLFGVAGNARTERLGEATGTAKTFVGAAHEQAASSVPPQAMIDERIEETHALHVVFGEKVFPGIDAAAWDKIQREIGGTNFSSTSDAKGRSNAVVRSALLEVYIDMTRSGANLTAYVRGEGGKQYPCTPLITTELQTLGLTWDQARVGKISALARRELWERALKAVKSKKRAEAARSQKDLDWH